MTISTAFEKIVYSEEYADKARKPNKYMVYRTRYARRKIGPMAMARIIYEWGGHLRANGKMIDEALREVFARKDYGKRWNSMAKHSYNRGTLKIGGKISVLKAFDYQITVELP